MSRFDEYFLMKNDDVVEYVKEKTDLFSEGNKLTCKEIGDGNLNYVFCVVDLKTNKSVIVKQAGEVARISSEISISTNRIKIESNILQLQDKYAPGLVPKVYFYDEMMNCFLMEDLSDHEIMRGALLEFKTFPLFSDDITTYMVKTLLPTTDVVMDHKKKKELLKHYINPDLCEITEDLVYSEPFNDYNNRNDLFEPNKEWIVEEIYNDEALRLEAAKLKFDFMTNAQALIHGDLHTGSIFITKDSTKVIDPEFAFYGPIGYDVGNVIANLVFTYVNGVTYKKEAFISWIEVTIKEVVDKFKEKFVNTWDEVVTDVMAKEPNFKAWYLDQILIDTAGVAGLELTRRIVGLAKVKDITSIQDSNDRVRAERVCLSLAKDLIKNRSTYKTGNDYLVALNDAMKKHN
ncbi:S-methyl-5-thioribose kinase [Bacillaceae bacterium S4-13-58]